MGMPSYDHDAENRCRETKEFQLYDAQRDVTEALQQLDDAEEARREERKINAASGVRNLTVDYELGSRIVGAKQMLSDAWKRYRAAGGKAKRQRDVPEPGADPCQVKLP